MNKIIVIVGPTSVGKTKMGVELAKRLNGEVISGDSMQIYKTMDIGTAKVTQEEMDGVVHHLIDVKNPDEPYSVKDFQDEVRKAIKDIQSRNKTVIIVGGTGLYIKAALYDYEFSETEIDHDVFKEKYKNFSNEQLYEYLKSFDEESAKVLHYNNRQRVLRAIEIYELTGKKKSETLEEQQHTLLYDAIFIGLTIDRELLYDRINKRVDIMNKNGLENEVQSLYEKGYTRNMQSMKAIGYKEWFDYFEGKISKNEVLELIKKNSRNYAKRQYTWFKNQFDMNWFEVNLNDFDETVNNVYDFIERT
jgi:tRNA dimethylallyltransferase